MLRLRDGGWVLLLAAVLMAGIVAWRTPVWLRSGRAIGDGGDPATYRFDLSRCEVPIEQIVGAGMPRDGLQALVDPPSATVAEIDALSWGGGPTGRHGHGRFLVPDDRVIGVHVGDESRAYPLSILNWHEVANDTVGGTPIAVTYNPLSDAVAVFDRRVGGEVLQMRFSGLLFNSTLLVHDARDEPAASSLWSQLLGRAVAGPAVGTELPMVGFAVVRWEDWLERHPETTVLWPDLALKRVYKRKPYESYRGSELLRFPVDRLAPDDVIGLKDPVIAVEIAGQRRVYPVAHVAAIAGEGGTWSTTLGGLRLGFETGTSPTVFVTAPTPGVRVWYASWFAWYALHPDDPVLPPQGDP